MSILVDIAQGVATILAVVLVVLWAHVAIGTLADLEMDESIPRHRAAVVLIPLAFLVLGLCWVLGQGI
jgi:hypothetical protein